VNHTHTSALQAEYDLAIGLAADATTKRADKWKQARGMAMGKQPKRDYSDKTRIDLNQPYQVAYWKQRFGVSDQELEDAVQAVGTLIEKIEAYLKSQGS
jgi:hypothetical protein